MSSINITGEPYKVHGRIVFSDYTYIRTAGFRWNDKDGNNVAVVGDSGPYDTVFCAHDVPFGFVIKAVAGKRDSKPYTIAPKYAWEKDGIFPGSIVSDPEDGFYKMWATCRAGGILYDCFLQSRDFEEWERPKLGLVNYEGNRDNNLIVADGGLGNIFYDSSGKGGKWKWIKESTLTRDELVKYLSRWDNEWDPKANRFDVIYDTHVGNPNLLICARGGVSEDGFMWKTLEEPLVVEHTDTIVTAYYDSAIGKYIGYFRDWSTLECDPDCDNSRKGLGWMAGRRSIGRAQTDVFTHFPLSSLISEPGPELLSPSQTIYTNGHTFFPGTSQHVFMPTVWDQASDATSIYTVSSTDGINLHWLPGNPILETNSFETYDGGCIFTKGDLLELPNGDWLMPYHSSNVPHKYPRKGYCEGACGFISWPKGRMIALNVKEYGQFTTMSLAPDKSHLRVNADILRGGSLSIEVTDARGVTLPGFSFNDCDSMTGDRQWTMMTWKGGDTISFEKGSAIMLRFRISYANLFGIEFC